jgi:malate dehydrogenase
MKISILGANGAVGAPAAFYIAIQQLADEIVMLGGKRQNVLQHHAIDISTAASTRDVLVRAGSYEDLIGSDIVINAAGLHLDGASARGEMLRQNTAFIKTVADNISRYCPEAIVLTATNPVDQLNYGTFLSGSFDRRKLIGYSINDSYRFRKMVAEALDARVSQVEGTVIGEHGPTQVLLFSSVRINGQAVSISEDQKQNIRDTAPAIIAKIESFHANRTAGWTCAVGLASFVKAIVEDSHEMLPCSAVLQGEYGQQGLSMSVPAIIGRQGIEEILELELSPDEIKGLENSTRKLIGESKIVEELLQLS